MDPQNKKSSSSSSSSKGQGLGREHAPPPPQKKRKVVVAPLPTSELGRYLQGYNPMSQANCASKQVMQLRLTSSKDDTKFVRFVVPATISMKKIGQLCAFLSGKVSDYDYRPNYGKNVPGSKIILTRGTGKQQKKLWLTGKMTGRKAAKEDADFIEDKTVNISEVFRGWTNGDTLEYRSEVARYMNETPGAVVFQFPSPSSSSSVTSLVECNEYFLKADGIFTTGCQCLCPVL